MNIKRGVSIGLALYAVTFIIGIILIILTKTNIDSPQNIPTTYWIITIVTTVILTSLASLWYFNKAKRNAKEGFKLGITFIITGLIIDLVSFLTQKNGVQLIKEYYSNISFYIVLILVVATCVFIGSRVDHIVEEKSKKPNKNKPKTKKKR